GHGSASARPAHSRRRSPVAPRLAHSPRRNHLDDRGRPCGCCPGSRRHRRSGRLRPAASHHPPDPWCPTTRTRLREAATLVSRPWPDARRAHVVREVRRTSLGHQLAMAGPPPLVVPPESKRGLTRRSDAAADGEVATNPVLPTHRGQRLTRRGLVEHPEERPGNHAGGLHLRHVTDVMQDEQATVRNRPGNLCRYPDVDEQVALAADDERRRRDPPCDPPHPRPPPHGP